VRLPSVRVTSSVFSTLLPAVVAVVMFGLGLELTTADFGRVASAPRAVLVVLACQIVALPALGAGLLLALDLPTSVALGVVVLLASPGGAMAAVFSHLAGGDVALNITATAINAALSLVTMPLLIGIGVHVLGADGAGGVTVPPDKVVQLVLVVLAPAALGMVLRHRRPELAARWDRPARIVSIVAVCFAIVTAVGQQAAVLLHGFLAVGGLAVLLCVLGMTIGYVVPRLARIGRPQAVSSSLEIGIHNVTLAITVCVSVLGDPQAAVVPAVYGALMFGPAAAFAWFLARRTSDRRTEPAPVGS